MFDTLDVSASGLRAQRIRMHTIANNLANVNTTRDANGNVKPFKRHFVEFVQGMQRGGSEGVRVANIRQDQGPAQKIYDPGHPEADKDGNRLVPNVKPIVEMVDMLEASRAYEANLTVMDTSKQLMTRSLGLLI